MRFDMIHNIGLREHFTGAYSATHTPSTGVDTQGLKNPTALVYMGAMTNSGGSPAETWTLTLEHSDSEGSGFETVNDGDIVYRSGRADAPSSGVFATIGDSTDSGSAADDSALYGVTYVGSKRYIRVVATAANTPGSTPITAFVIGTPFERPAADSV
jgi:hypothetical protein